MIIEDKIQMARNDFGDKYLELVVAGMSNAKADDRCTVVDKV